MSSMLTVQAFGWRAAQAQPIYAIGSSSVPYNQHAKQLTARSGNCQASAGFEKPSSSYAASSIPLALLLGRVGPALADGGASAASASPIDNGGWLSPIVDGLNLVLSNVETFYLGLGLPYAYGWSIVTLTALVKVLTLPLTKKQVESALAVQALKPRVDVIKDRYGDDKTKVQKETSRLYEQAQINPLAGCFPSLLQLPIYFGLFRSLSNATGSGTLDNEGFYWLPSLSGPVSNADRIAGLGTSWLYPFVDGHPPIGWDHAAPYLVLPILLVAAQYASSAVLSPIDPNTENATTQRLIIYALPLTIGYFSLTVPSGLSLYYFSNSIFTTAQQIYFRKLGGASVATPDLGPVTKLGMGRKTGKPVHVPKAAAALPETGGSDALAAEFGAPVAPEPSLASNSSGASNGAAPAQPSNAGGTEPAVASVQETGASDEGDGDTGILGGLVVATSEMQGVAEEELEYLQRRCRRRRVKERAGAL